MKKFFGNLKVVLNGPLDDQQSGQGQLFADLELLGEIECEFDGTAP